MREIFSSSFKVLFYFKFLNFVQDCLHFHVEKQHHDKPDIGSVTLKDMFKSYLKLFTTLYNQLKNNINPLNLLKNSVNIIIMRNPVSMFTHYKGSCTL